jgi:putative glycosyltransferase (TIGR04372 family)
VRLIRKLVQVALTVVMLPFLCAVRLFSRFFQVRTFMTHQQLFGHLALEPTKYLAAKDLKIGLHEIGFDGEKIPSNISVTLEHDAQKRYFDLWSFGNTDGRANKQLVKMWKREVRSIPSWLMGALLGANQRLRKPAIVDYRFSTLVSVDRYLDGTKSHLAFSSTERKNAQSALRKMGIKEDRPFVCLVARHGGEQDSSLRNRSIEDFESSVEALTQRGITVVRMGSKDSPPLRSLSPLVIDYANSEHKSELVDIYLLAHCHFIISTMSGPDAMALAFRRPALYIDIAHYSLCFTGSSLTTWTPAKIVRSNNKQPLSLREVFNTGAGYFWKDSQFASAGLEVLRSTPDEIRNYVMEMMDRLAATGGASESLLQAEYRKVMMEAMGDLGHLWHGEVRSQIPEFFLDQNADWLLRQ